MLDSQKYIGLSHPAKALLLEFAREYTGANNGSLKLERTKLAKRGWRGPAVIQRARDQLIAAGFVHETVKGQRPNKASQYAVTWHTLDKTDEFDAGTALTFVRGGYREPLLPAGKLASTSPVQGAQKILSTPPVQEKALIGTAPIQGERSACTSPVPISPGNEPPPCTPPVQISRSSIYVPAAPASGSPQPATPAPIPKKKKTRVHVRVRRGTIPAAILAYLTEHGPTAQVALVEHAKAEHGASSQGSYEAMAALRKAKQIVETKKAGVFALSRTEQSKKAAP
ncbi:MAG: hypothetical protein ABI601_18625 [bacterium]